MQMNKITAHMCSNLLYLSKISKHNLESTLRAQFLMKV